MLVVLELWQLLLGPVGKFFHCEPAGPSQRPMALVQPQEHKFLFVHAYIAGSTDCLRASVGATGTCQGVNFGPRQGDQTGPDGTV